MVKGIARSASPPPRFEAGRDGCESSGVSTEGFCGSAGRTPTVEVLSGRRPAIGAWAEGAALAAGRAPTGDACAKRAARASTPVNARLGGSPGEVGRSAGRAPTDEGVTRRRPARDKRRAESGRGEAPPGGSERLGRGSRVPFASPPRSAGAPDSALASSRARTRSIQARSARPNPSAATNPHLCHLTEDFMSSPWEGALKSDHARIRQPCSARPPFA